MNTGYVNTTMAERRARRQGITGKVGDVHSGNAVPDAFSTAYQSRDAFEQRAVNKDAGRGVLGASVGAYVNQQGIDVQAAAEHHLRHRASPPRIRDERFTSYSASPSATVPAPAPEPTHAHHRGFVPAAPVYHLQAPLVGGTGKGMTNSDEHATLMELVYRNHAEATRSYLDFKPDAVY
jgi:hypothetical protein